MLRNDVEMCQSGLIPWGSKPQGGYMWLQWLHPKKKDGNSMWQTTFKQDHNQAIKHRADYFKPFWKTKKGHWKLIYPGIDEIEGLNCMLTVECLDCGAVIMRTAHHWLVDNNQFGCSNCFAHRGVAQKVKMLEAQGFKALSAEIKGKFRVYTMECPKCGLVFDQWGPNLKRWIKNGAKCPGCLNKDEFPPDAVRIRKACIEAGITYLDLGEKTNYSESRVRNIANGIAYNEKTAKRIADVAEKIVKEKQ